MNKSPTHPDDFPTFISSSSSSIVENSNEETTGLEANGVSSQVELPSSAAFELAEDVFSFAEKLKPWRALMPLSLRDDMDDIVDKSRKIESKYVFGQAHWESIWSKCLG